jgi:hypothetical protein
MKNLIERVALVQGKGHLENFKKRIKALEDKVANDGIILTNSQVAALEKKRMMTRLYPILLYKCFH